MQMRADQAKPLLEFCRHGIKLLCALKFRMRSTCFACDSIYAGHKPLNMPKLCSMPPLLPHTHALQVLLPSFAMCKHLGMLVQTANMSYCREVRTGMVQQLPWKLCLCSQVGAEHIDQLWRGWQLLSELCGLHNTPFQVAPAPPIRPTVSLLLAGKN